MTDSIRNEISMDIPPGVPGRYLAGGAPLFTAYGCAVLERNAGKSWAYTAVNLKNGRKELLLRRTRRIDENAYTDIAAKIRTSSLRGAGRHEIDREPGESVNLTALQETLGAIFLNILPLHGYTLREKQTELAAHMLDAIGGRSVTLAEAGVGTGKTHAYLVAAILAKRGRLNDFWLRGNLSGQSYAESVNMPVVISTSSIALQKAIAADYIPELSDILMRHGIIRTPVTCAVRKGKEHYLCERRLRACLLFEPDGKARQAMEALLSPSASIDLTDAEGITPYIKRKIHAPGRCERHCRYFNHCRYQRFLEHANNPAIDIQITNHNYLLADTLKRAGDGRPLIPRYQCLIVDEAHKFLTAARQMYGTELSGASLAELTEDISSLRFKREGEQHTANKTARKLKGQSNRLFRALTEAIPTEEYEDAERFPANFDGSSARHLRNIRDISSELNGFLKTASVRGRTEHTRFELRNASAQAGALAGHADMICWLEKPDASTDETILCGIPRDLDKRLRRDLWSDGIPVILTSGTLSASDGDFSRAKRTLGLDTLRGIRETTKPSPFDYHNNALLYISENVPFPNTKAPAYISAAVKEIERLVLAAHGHAAVLFTSYKAMDMVWEQLSARDIPFPMFRLDKGGVSAIERFKASGDGLLFASGALWEGIDIPGDALSLLIIVRLPFAVPDPISDYERTLHADMDDYKMQVVVPDMLLKLKQGFGRLIRMETDTGVCAILDSRARLGGSYRAQALRALPACAVTSDISDIAAFIRQKKAPEYFTDKRYSHDGNRLEV